MMEDLLCVSCYQTEQPSAGTRSVLISFPPSGKERPLLAYELSCGVRQLLHLCGSCSLSSESSWWSRTAADRRIQALSVQDRLDEISYFCCMARRGLDPVFCRTCIGQSAHSHTQLNHFVHATSRRDCFTVVVKIRPASIMKC